MEARKITAAATTHHQINKKAKADAWSGVRTHADKRPADLKSAPLDPSGIQANAIPGGT